MKAADLLDKKAELKRKIIHLSCAVLPLLYYFSLSREQIIVLCSIISIFFLIAEFFRFRHKQSGLIFEKIFFPLLREDEKNKYVTGATYLFISATITFILFKKEIAVPAVLILTISDSFAAIVGKMTVSAKFFNKSLAGSITFFVISLCILFLFVPELGWLNLIIAVILMLVEAVPLSINDNLLISLTAGFMLSLFI